MKILKRILLIVVALAILAGVVLYEIGLTDFRFKKTPDPDKIRVACVGDSITYGCLVPLRGRNNYPKKLQKLLGEEYQVENFGLSSRTLQNTGDEPYQKEEEFRRSLNFNPNILIIKLGTNDTKPQNWTSAEAYEEEYRNFLMAYETLPNPPAIYLCTPAAAYQAKGTSDGLYKYGIRENELEQARAVVRKLAAEKGYGLIDVAEQTKDHRDWFVFDGIHPNAKGAQALAGIVAKAIQG